MDLFLLHVLHLFIYLELNRKTVDKNPCKTYSSDVWRFIYPTRFQVCQKDSVPKQSSDVENVSHHVLSRNVSLRVTDGWFNKQTIRTSEERLSLTVFFISSDSLGLNYADRKREMMDSRETRAIINRQPLALIYEAPYRSSPPRALRPLY